MAITIDQAALGVTSSAAVTLNTATLTTTAAAASNSLIVAAFFTIGTTSPLTSVSGGGLTWAVDSAGVYGVSGGGIRFNLASAQAPSGLASSTVISPTFSAPDTGVPIVWGAVSILGAKTSSPFDVGDGTGGTAHDTIAGNAWTTNNATIQAGSILFGFACDDNSTNNTATSPSIEAWDKADAAGFGGCCCYRIEASAGTYAVAGTFGGGTGNILCPYVAYLAEPPPAGIDRIHGLPGKVNDRAPFFSRPWIRA